MIKLLFLTLVFFSSLLANKVIYLNYEEIPTRVIKGEIFPLTIKSLSTLREHKDIEYSFSNYSGLKILDATPLREKKGKYFYDTFNFLVTSKWAKLPDVEASLSDSQEYDSSKLVGKNLNVISLNPKKDFSNIIANSLKLEDYKTTSYDKEHNIVVFVASALNADLGSMQFKDLYKQGIESLQDSYLESRITYFVVIDKRVENFSFTYFNLQSNSFSLLNIPIIVDDDSVTTQSDLKPKDQSKERLKMSIAGGVALVAFLFILFRKKYIYLIFLTLPLAYIAYLAIPAKEICIRAGSDIHLLPVENGTIFETTQEKITLLQEGSSRNFTKVKLHNEKIGWVKNEDICTY